MFKKVQYGLLSLGLLIPFVTQAAPCDFAFTSSPAFSSLCLGAISTGTYTIQNNTPVPMKLNYIRIADADALPAAATAIVAAPTSSCVAGTSLAAGATCNILVNLLPLELGTFNRTLQVGIDSRQVQLSGSTITAAINCTPAAPAVPAVPVGPAPTPAPASLYQASILGSSTVTNIGPSVVNGDVDVSPGSAITGFPPGTIVNGTTNAANATAATARADALAYYNSAVGLACGTNLTGQDLGGKTLAPGVYCFDTSAQLTGALTLAGTSSTSSYTFIIGSTLTTASNSSIVLTGGVTNGNVTWAVGSSATLGTGTAFQGIIDAVASITLTNGTSLLGRAWALNGAVTLDTNVVNPN